MLTEQDSIQSKTKDSRYQNSARQYTLKDKIKLLDPEIRKKISKFTRNMNGRQNMVSQLIQSDRESQFPNYYEQKGVCAQQEEQVKLKESFQYKINDGREQIQNVKNKDSVFSTIALVSPKKQSNSPIKKQQKKAKTTILSTQATAYQTGRNQQKRYLKKSASEFLPKVIENSVKFFEDQTALNIKIAKEFEVKQKEKEEKISAITSSAVAKVVENLKLSATTAIEAIDNLDDNKMVSKFGMPTEKYMKVLGRRFIDSKKFKQQRQLIAFESAKKSSPSSKKNLLVSELGSILLSQHQNSKKRSLKRAESGFMKNLQQKEVQFKISIPASIHRNQNVGGKTAQTERVMQRDEIDQSFGQENGKVQNATQDNFAPKKVQLMVEREIKNKLQI